MPHIDFSKDRIPLLQGVDGKLGADLNAASPFDPFPVSDQAIANVHFSASGKAALAGDVSLGVSGETSVLLAVGFAEKPGGAASLIKEFDLATALTPANLMMGIEVGGKADLSASGSYKYSVLSAGVNLQAGADARFVNTRVFPDRQSASGKVMEAFLQELRTPGQVTQPPEPGQVFFLEYGGYLKFGASLTAGYEIKGTHQFENVNDLKLSEHYKFSANGTLTVGAQIAGRFSIEARASERADWARVTVKRQRSDDLTIAADISVNASVGTGGLPHSGKEFLGALLGLRAKNWINQVSDLVSRAASIHTKDDLKKQIDGLTQVYLSRFADKALDDLLPAEVTAMMAKMKAVMGSYNSVGDQAVALFDRYFGVVEDQLKPALAAIEKMTSWEHFSPRVHGQLWTTVFNAAQQLTDGNLLDFVLDKTTGLSNLQAAATRAGDLLKDGAHEEIRKLIGIANREFDLNKLVNEIAPFLTVEGMNGKMGAEAQGLVGRLTGKAVSALNDNDVKALTGFVQEVQKAEDGFFSKFDKVLEEAAQQSFTADIGIAYDRASESGALLDLDVRLRNEDGSACDAGVGLMKMAGLGDFRAMLTDPDPAVVFLRDCSLIHKSKRSTGIRINVAGWHKGFQYAGLYQVVTESKQRIRTTSSGSLNVFTAVTMNVGHDETRKRNKHEEQMHTNFTLRFLGQSNVPAGAAGLSEADLAYLIDVITSMTAEYASKLVDSDTTPAKLNTMLEFARTLGLDRQGATADALRPLLPAGKPSLGHVEAEYRVRFAPNGLRSLLQGDTVSAANVRELLKNILVASYARDESLAPAAWLYASDKVRNIYEDAGPRFTDGGPFSSLTNAILNGELEKAPRFGLAPDYSSDSQATRRLVDTLFRIEDSLTEGFKHLRDAVAHPDSPKKLEQASGSFGEALNTFDSMAGSGEGSNPVFAVMDGLIQIASPGVNNRDAVLSIRIGEKTMLCQLVADPAAAIAAAGGLGAD